MYNEVEYGPHVYRQLDDCLNLDVYDAIVVLDDGSNDGTWDVLKEYANKYDIIHIYRNDKNSIKEYSENRWKTLNRLAGEFDPTWIHLRAADMLYSFHTKKYLKGQLERFLDENVYLVGIPIAHLWRSETWYRADNIWGRSVKEHMTRTFYRYNKNAVWGDVRSKAGMHQGAAIPDNLGFDKSGKTVSINDYIDKVDDYWPIVGLHLGHTTHEKKVRKFNWSMESAKAVGKYGRSISMPPPDKMPPVRRWLEFNGYKGFVEWNMVLKKVPQLWFAEKIVYGTKPVPRSIYETIKVWNPTRAEEYREIFNNHYGNN